MTFYGPRRPPSGTSHLDIVHWDYLDGFADKVRQDLAFKARYYDGLQVRVFSYDSSDERCDYCMDTITGARTVADCPVCGGSGRRSGFQVLGDYWVKVDFGPKQNASGEYGNTENVGIQADTFIFYDAPLLKDQDLVAVIDTKEIYKIISTEPAIVAMGGNVVAQLARCSMLTPGSHEYDLITW